MQVIDTLCKPPCWLTAGTLLVMTLCVHHHVDTWLELFLSWHSVYTTMLTNGWNYSCHDTLCTPPCWLMAGTLLVIQLSGLILYKCQFIIKFYTFMGWILRKHKYTFVICIIFNSFPTQQNVHHFADNIFRYIFVNERKCILITISLTFVPKSQVDNKPALV